MHPISHFRVGTGPFRSFGVNTPTFMPPFPTEKRGAPESEPVYPRLESGWTNSTVRYWRDKSGIIHLEGSALYGTGYTPAPLFVLPDKFRPPNDRFMTCVCTNGPALTQLTAIITTDGCVTIAGGIAAGRSVYIDGLSFKPE